MAYFSSMLKTGIALIGPSGTGKTTIGRILARKLGMDFHDMDDDGLEGMWGKDGVARVLLERGDDGFLEAEGSFVIEHYGRSGEGKKYDLDTMVFSTSGSIILEQDAIEYIGERMMIIYLDLPDAEIARRARARGVTRIVGMNGENPRFHTVEEVLEYRRGYYEKYADIRIPLTVGTSPEEDAEEIYELLQKILP